MSADAGIIFDLDDTLAATALLWRRAEEGLLGALNQRWSAELAARYKGMNALDVAATIHRAVEPAHMTLEACQRHMRQALLAQFAAAPVRATAGAVACIRRLQPVAPLAVASGSPLEAIEKALADLGVRDAFAAVLSSESVGHGKPNPAVFLAAAAALGVAPERCVVFEDSLVGLEAATRAGMGCIVVPSAQPAELFVGRAAAVHGTLAEVSVADVRRLLQLDTV